MRLIWTFIIVVWTAVPVLAEEVGHGEAPSPFAGTLYQSVAAVVVFLTLLAVLKAKAWGPIIKGLQDREAKIKGDLERAETAARSATATLEQYRQQLAAAQDEARKVIEQARKDADGVAAEIKNKAQADITLMKNRATAEIISAKEQAVADIYEKTATLATQVAGRILQREINAADQQRLISDSLAQLKNSQN